MPDIKVTLPPDLLSILGANPEKKLPTLVVIELYREGKLTLRQAGDILGLNYRQMEDLLGKHNVFLEMNSAEIDEELRYGFSSE